MLRSLRLWTEASRAPSAGAQEQRGNILSPADDRGRLSHKEKTMKNRRIWAAVLTLFACAHHKTDNPYAKTLFIEQFLDPANPLDAQIQQTIRDLRANPRSAVD